MGKTFREISPQRAQRAQRPRMPEWVGRTTQEEPIVTMQGTEEANEQRHFVVPIEEALSSLD
jgi:hypothetical protein